jgi:hypothetical protein
MFFIVSQIQKETEESGAKRTRQDRYKKRGEGLTTTGFFQVQSGVSDTRFRRFPKPARPRRACSHYIATEGFKRGKGEAVVVEVQSVPDVDTVMSRYSRTC